MHWKRAARNAAHYAQIGIDGYGALKGMYHAGQLVYQAARMAAPAFATAAATAAAAIL